MWWQLADHTFEQEATRRFTRSRVTRHITRNVAVENLTCCVGVFTNLHLKVRSDVVQTKRYEATFDETVNAKRNYRVLVSSPLREGRLQTNRPNEGQHNASKDGSRASRNDRHKAFTGKKPRYSGSNTVETVKHVR